MGTNKGAQLPDDIEHRDPCAFLRIRVLVVDGPGDDDGDGGEEAAGRGINPGIAPPDAGALATGAGDGHGGVAESCKEGVEGDEEAAVAETVREVACQEDDYEGDQVWLGRGWISFLLG